MSATAAILSLAAIVAFVAATHSRRTSRMSQHCKVESIKKVRLVELSGTLAAQIFQRTVGSFGYYYVRKSEAADGSPCWVAPMNIGEGSGYDTAERAEEYARRNAASEA
jgi:hypothetical protein